MELKNDTGSPKRLPLWNWAAYAALCFALVLALQYWHGAYHSDLGEDPDESAHAVTSLMLRDYLTEAPGSNPLAFAQSYYDRLPKVALGHYPPGFYAIAGAWLLPLPRIGMLLILHAALLAGFATFAVWWGSHLLPRWLAWLTGFAICLAAPVQKVALLIMSDFLLGLLCLWAAASFWRFLEKPSARSSLAFGLLASAAILTKGSGWMMGAVPPLAIALSGQWKRLWQPSLWLAPLPVLLIALPWQLFSYRFTADGMSGLGVKEHFLYAVGFYAEAFVDSYGWPMAILSAVAVLAMLLRRIRGKGLPASEATLWALLGAAILVVLTIPAGVSSRYLVPMTGPLLLVLAHFVWSLGTSKQGSSIMVVRRALLVFIAVSLAIGCSHKDLAKSVSGYTQAVATIASDADSHADSSWLVCSDVRGEGAVIAAAAFEPSLRRIGSISVRRATKDLAAMDWLGRGYKAAFADEAALLQHLAEKKVRWVLFDDSAPHDPRYRPPYFDQLQKALEMANSGWQKRHTVPITRLDGERGEMFLYLREPSGS